MSARTGYSELNAAFTAAVRERRGSFTVAEMAQAAGLSTSAMSRRLGNRVSWTLADLGLLGDLFGCGLDGLMVSAGIDLGYDADVAEGGRMLTRWHGQPDSDALVLLGQVVDVDGPKAIVSTEEVRNGSGRVVGERYMVTRDAAEAIRAALAASAQ